MGFCGKDGGGMQRGEVWAAARNEEENEVIPSVTVKGESERKGV